MDVLELRVSIGGEEDAGDAVVAGAGGDMERGLADLVLRVDVLELLGKKLTDLHMLAIGG